MFLSFTPPQFQILYTGAIPAIPSHSAKIQKVLLFLSLSLSLHAFPSYSIMIGCRKFEQHRRSDAIPGTLVQAENV